jgi:urease accessory protein
VRASASATAIVTAAGTRLRDLRSEAPLLLRETPGALYLVGGAAGPLGGDDLELRIDVHSGATLHVRSAAATLAQPGPNGDGSISRIQLCVHDRGCLTWEPEPLVSVRGSHHTIETDVQLARDARLRLVEEVVLGRWNEASGRVTTRLRITRGGAPLVAHDLDLGGGAVGWSSAAVLGEARCIRTEVVVGPPAGAARVEQAGLARAASFPLAADTTLVVALGPTLAAARLAAARLVADAAVADPSFW